MLTLERKASDTHMTTDHSSEICSFDDLSVTVATRGTVTLSCPVCGPVGTAVVRTLSDLTNAAIEHLEIHPEALRHARLAAA
jgi:hypothetical protein